MKIKSGPLVVELDLRRLSICSELKAGKEHQASQQIFSSLFPQPVSVYINLRIGHFQGICAWLG